MAPFGEAGVLGRWSVAAVAKVKATAVVVAVVTAGGVGGVVALSNLAPVSDAGAPAGQHHRQVVPWPAPSSPSSAGPTSPVPRRQPAPARHLKAATGSAAAAPTPRDTRQGSTSGPARTDPSGGNHASRTGAAPAPSPTPTPTATATSTVEPVVPVPAATPPADTGGPATPDCSGDAPHGDAVSNTAHDAGPGTDHGSAVKDTAHSDCGKPSPGGPGNGHDGH